MIVEMSTVWKVAVIVSGPGDVVDADVGGGHDRYHPETNLAGSCQILEVACEV